MDWMVALVHAARAISISGLPFVLLAAVMVFEVLWYLLNRKALEALDEEIKKMRKAVSTLNAMLMSRVQTRPGADH